MMRARAGFTIMELLVAMVVGSLALLAGMSALGFVDERSRHADEATRVAIGGAAQRAMLVDWLNGARFRAPTGEQFEGMQEDMGGVMTSLLLLPTTARTPLGHGYTVVGLHIDVDPETPERGLVAEMTGTTFGPEPRRMEIVPEAGLLFIRYLSAATDGEWMETWNSQRLPRAIELTMLPATGDTLPPLLRYPIRVALRSSQ